MVDDLSGVRSPSAMMRRVLARGGRSVITARLVVGGVMASRVGGQEEASVEPAHEALLRRWERLAGLVQPSHGVVVMEPRERAPDALEP